MGTGSGMNEHTHPGIREMNPRKKEGGCRSTRLEEMAPDSNGRVAKPAPNPDASSLRKHDYRLLVRVFPGNSFGVYRRNRMSFPPGPSSRYDA